MLASLYQNPFSHGSLANLSILITGGAGFIGSHIAEYLLIHGAKKVRVIDDLSTGFRENITPFLKYPAFEFIEGDIRHFPTCLEVCKGMDMVCHQAAIGSVPRSIENPTYTTSVNVDGFVNMVKAAQEQGVKRVVYASSSSVYGDEQTLPKQESKILNITKLLLNRKKLVRYWSSARYCVAFRMDAHRIAWLGMYCNELN